MANPNIVNVTSIYGKSVGMTVTNSSQALIAASHIPTGKVAKLNSIIISNVDSSASDDITVTWSDASASVTYHLAKAVTVPHKSTLIVLGKDAPIYLEEGDSINVLGAQASGALEAIASFEVLDDA